MAVDDGAIALAREIVGRAPPAIGGARPITIIGMAILVAVEAHGDEPVTVGALFDAIGLPLPSGHPVLTQLEIDGLVKRERHRFNHRITLVTLTVKGHRALRRARRHPAAARTIEPE